MYNVGIAISTWNRADDLKRCLKLLMDQDISDSFLISIVDNCSNDNTNDVINDLISNYSNNIFYYVMPHSNFSAIYTINYALRQLYTDYVVIIDDDTFLEDPTTIRRLVETAETDRNIAIVATNVRTHDNRVSLAIKTPKFDAVEYSDVSPNEVFDIDDFSGACALFRWDIVGPDFYDESFQLYWNEPELAIRMVANNYRVVVNQSIRVIHGSDVGRESCRSFYFGSRNTFRLMSKVLPVKTTVLLTCILLPFHLKRYLSMYKEKNFNKYLIKLLYAYLQSIYRAFFAERIEFKDYNTQFRVYDAYKKYFLKELLWGLQ